MSDPRVDVCIHTRNTDSGKLRCVFPNRDYYFCKTNRRENVCPLGYSTTYDDPEIKVVRPFESAFTYQMNRFHEGHATDRWNIKNRMDSFQLYYYLDLIAFRYFELAMMYNREGQYKNSHVAWAKHDAFGVVKNELFPYKDGGGKNLNNEYMKLKREIETLESLRQSTTAAQEQPKS
jgi:hypothetical protein